MLELINELLDLSRIEAGRLETAIQPVTLLPVMERALQLVGPLLQQKNVALINECDRDLAETIGQVVQTTPAHAGAGSSILDDKKG